MMILSKFLEKYTKHYFLCETCDNFESAYTPTEYQLKQQRKANQSEEKIHSWLS